MTKKILEKNTPLKNNKTSGKNSRKQPLEKNSEKKTHWEKKTPEKKT